MDQNIMASKTSPVMAGSKTRHFRWTLDDNGTDVHLEAVATGARKTFTTASVHPELISRVMQYGLKQLLSDRTADIPATADKLSEMDTIAEMFSKGIWTDRATGERQASPAKLHTLVARAYGKTLEQVASIFAMKKDSLGEEGYKAWLAAVKKDPKVLKAEADIKAEEAREAAKAAKAAGTESLASDFG